MVADIEEPETLDASGIPCSEAQCEGGSDAENGVADGTVKVSGRDQIFRRSTSIRGQPARGEEHNDVLRGESDGSQPVDTLTADGEAPSR